MLKRKFQKPEIYTKDKGKLVIHQFRPKGHNLRRLEAKVEFTYIVVQIIE